MKGSKASKHIGIVACSAEGAALCYRTICMEAPALLGEHLHPEISMHTYPLGNYMVHIRSGNWEEVSSLMLSSARKLAQIGADFAICPDNTIHQAFDFVVTESPIPWLHIAETVAQHAAKQGFKRLALIGTSYLMISPVYPKILDKLGIYMEIPNESEREKINAIIFNELVNGIFLETSRLYLNEVIKELKKRGCDAVVLGCTEIPLLVVPNDCPLPTLDSTRLLARAALKEAIKITG
ncbi:MAG: amino acid racemase [Thermodesulfobacteriota bacterium]